MVYVRPRPSSPHPSSPRPTRSTSLGANTNILASRVRSTPPPTPTAKPYTPPSATFVIPTMPATVDMAPLLTYTPRATSTDPLSKILDDINGRLAQLFASAPGLYAAIDTIGVPAAQRNKLKTRPLDALVEIFDPIKAPLKKIIDRANQISGIYTRPVPAAPWSPPSIVDMRVSQPDDTKFSPSVRDMLERFRIPVLWFILSMQDPIALTAAAIQIAIEGGGWTLDHAAWWLLNESGPAMMYKLAKSWVGDKSLSGYSRGRGMGAMTLQDLARVPTGSLKLINATLKNWSYGPQLQAALAQALSPFNALSPNEIAAKTEALRQKIIPWVILNLPHTIAYTDNEPNRFPPGGFYPKGYSAGDIIPSGYIGAGTHPVTKTREATDDELVSIYNQYTGPGKPTAADWGLSGVSRGRMAGYGVAHKYVLGSLGDGGLVETAATTEVAESPLEAAAGSTSTVPTTGTTAATGHAASDAGATAEATKDVATPGLAAGLMQIMQALLTSAGGAGTSTTPTTTTDPNQKDPTPGPTSPTEPLIPIPVLLMGAAAAAYLIATAKKKR